MFNYRINPNQLVQMIRQGQNPQQLMLSILQQNSNTPLGANLYKLAQNGNTAEIEKIARNMCRERGIDFDTEFNSFKHMIGLN